MRHHRLFTAIASMLLVACGSPLFAGITVEEAATGRALLQRYADVVIGVELVTTLKGTVNDRPLPPQERKMEANGTVITPGGLTVLSLGSIDPRSGINMPNARIEEPEFKEVKLRLADGTEYPARVVLKDEELDLAFVAPEAPAEGAKLPVFPHVRLDDAARGEVLGNYYDIARGNKRVQRVPAVRLVSVTGILQKPRPFLLATDYSPGCPVFDAAGKLLGVSVRHIVEGRPVGMVILPAADIAEVAPVVGAP
jgi:hypothetical protein